MVDDLSSSLIAVNDVEYHNVSKIGEGSYGSVHLVCLVGDANLRGFDFFAVKSIALDTRSEDDDFTTSIAAAREEESLQKTVQHENVVRILDASTHDSLDIYRIRMEVVEYELHSVIRGRNDQHRSTPMRFSEKELRGYVKQLMTGIAHCHLSHVVHCDINTRNVLIDSNGCVKIADFGLARVIEKPVHALDRAVTIYFRPPELLLFDIQNPQTKRAVYFSKAIDIWSAGCVMAEMMIGDPLIVAKHESEMLAKTVKLLGTPNDRNFELMRWNIDFCRKVPGRPSMLFNDARLSPWIADSKSRRVVDLLQEMLNVNLIDRPTAQSIVDRDYMSSAFGTDGEDAPMTQSEIAGILRSRDSSKILRSMDHFRHNHPSTDSNKRKRLQSVPLAPES